VKNGGKETQLEEVEVYEDNIKMGIKEVEWEGVRQLIWCRTGRSGSCKGGNRRVP